VAVKEKNGKRNEVYIQTKELKHNLRKRGE
jgi:hypothetical protein